jgi:hypothetical protein
VRGAAFGLDALEQRLQLVGRAPRDTGDEALAEARAIAPPVASPAR